MKITIENSDSNDVTLAVTDSNRPAGSAPVFNDRLNAGDQADIQITSDGSKQGAIKVKIEGGPTTAYDHLRDGQVVNIN